MGEHTGILVFHPTIAPYRVDFFNGLYDKLGADIALYYDKPQSFEVEDDQLSEKLHFTPDCFSVGAKIMGHDIYPGYSLRLARKDPDIVICNGFDAGLMSTVLYKKVMKKKYRIFTICDDSLEMAASTRGVKGLMRERLIKHVDGLILNNYKAAAYYKDMYGKESFVFPIIPRAERFYEDKDEAVSLARSRIEEYGLAGRRIFIYVGRLAKEKNLEYLIDSFVKDHKNHNENILFILGDESNRAPGYADKLKKMVEDNDAGEYIRFEGRKSGTELKSWYYMGQCLVLPGYYEPFGSAVGEALLAGERVMVSESAGASVLVKKSVLKGNGFGFDLSEESIDFDKMAYKIPVTEADWKEKESRMYMDFDELMDGLCEWLLCTHR